MGRWVQLFEADHKQLSMTRLLCFMSFFPASYVVVTNPSEGMLGWYLGAYVLGYIGGKSADAFASSAENKTASITDAGPAKKERKKC